MVDLLAEPLVIKAKNGDDQDTGYSCHQRSDTVKLLLSEGYEAEATHYWKED